MSTNADDALNLLGQRLRSQIDSPVARAGIPIRPPIPDTLIPYDGTPLTYFLLRNQAAPFGYRKFLRANKIGRAVGSESILRRGLLVKVAKRPPLT